MENSTSEEVNFNTDSRVSIMRVFMTDDHIVGIQFEDKNKREKNLLGSNVAD